MAKSEEEKGAKPEGDAGEAPAKSSKKKMMIIAGAALLLVLGGGGAAYFLLFSGGEENAVADAHGAPAADAHGAPKDAHGEAKKEAGHGDAHGKAADHKKDDGHGGGHGAADAHTANYVPGQPVFFDLPAILVNLRSDEKPVFLKLVVSLELSEPNAIKAVEGVLPRVVDQFQTYLRELRVEELSGSAATIRLKEELLRRVKMAASPVEVQDVLFKDMIIQ
ncbi:MAG TPA: flagellar basal body protein FliL [Alphaproteobacteria bacterium]|nr:flagellar basal body protein FliL [Alphaproteobacteria bacterium]HAJ48585.1 flagellar basal body protein FliL [Alphaproteobacteria bacterium]